MRTAERRTTIRATRRVSKLEPIVEGLQGIDPRMKSFTKELSGFFNDEFGDRRFFTIAYGSFAYGINKPDSDLDLVTICDWYAPEQLERTIRYVVEFHKGNGLALDNEVPHSRKLLMTFEQLEHALAGECFRQEGFRIIVPPVIKERSFLDSEEVALRLLINAMTGNNIFICGNQPIHGAYVKRMRRQLVPFVFSIERAASFTIEEFVRTIIGTNETHGEEYLGYKDAPAIREYLRRAFAQTFLELEREGFLERYANRYFVKDHGWMASVVCGMHEVHSLSRDITKPKEGK